MKTKTIRRNWLYRQIEAGKVTGMCNLHLTDDYAYDNATGFGETEWMPVRIRHPKFEKITLYNGSVIDHCADYDFVENTINLNESDLEGNSGRASWNDDDTIYFRVHCNLYYTLKLNA